MEKNAFLQVPSGFKDWLPGEGCRKRALENKFASLFRQWSYREVVTPTLEYFRVLQMGNGCDGGNERRIFKFIDRQGEILALRPDMTTPIARMVASRMQDSPLPLRLFYLANVFRHETPQEGRRKEFFQAGVELLGGSSPEADAEVITLAAEALSTAGLKDFRIGIGQVEVTRRVLEGLSLTGGESEKVKEALARKDLVGLECLLEKAGVPESDKERVLAFSSLHGGKEALEQAQRLAGNREIEEALKSLRAVFEVLEACGLGDKVFLDLGILRDFNYYTGIVFEGYTESLGFPLCGGGRYDSLLGNFGYPCPATGFALGLERIMLVLEREPATVEDQEPKYFLTGRNCCSVFKEAERLRKLGCTVEVDVLNLSPEEARKYAESKGFTDIIVVKGEKGSE